MIIFGTRSVTSSAGSGLFYCPECRLRTHYGHKRVRRFFHLYFIPIIPLDVYGEYIECQRCGGTYRTEVLEFDPEASAMQLEAEFHRAIKQVMVRMMLADGAVQEEEIQLIQRIYEQLTGKELAIEAVHDEISRAESDRREIGDVLGQVAGALNDHGKELVIKAAFLVATADGEFHEDEQALLGAVGQSLGMSSAHLNGVIASMLPGLQSANN